MKKICEMDVLEYYKLRDSGLFWELYPNAKGIYDDDKKLSARGKFKIEQNDDFRISDKDNI